MSVYLPVAICFWAFWFLGLGFWGLLVSLRTLAEGKLDLLLQPFAFSCLFLGCLFPGLYALLCLALAVCSCLVFLGIVFGACFSLSLCQVCMYLNCKLSRVVHGG